MAYVPPQNSTLVFLHFGFSMSLAISSTPYSKLTTLTGSGYASPNTALSPGILYPLFRSNSFEYTLTSRFIHSRLISSILASSVAAIWDLCEKSKRSFVGATSDPFWSI